MRYLFFDTESSNCYRGVHKMCEYGQALTDEGFRLLEEEQKDILLNPNPNGKFNLRSKEGDGITLAHEEKEYFASPKFPSIYDYLDEALTDPDTAVFLWSGENDVRTIVDSCHRYGLPGIAFVCYDVQVLYHHYLQRKGENVVSLSKAMEALGIDMTGIIPHRPDHDAIMTMLVLKGLCKRCDKSVRELIASCPEAGYSSLSKYRELRDKAIAKQKARKASALAQSQAKAKRRKR